MKTKLLKLLVVMTISITALFALGITASAATVGDLTITLTEGGGDPVLDTDYTYVDNSPYAPGVLTIKSSAAMTISGTTTTDRIVVETGVSANITLNGVNIDTSNALGAAFVIADNSTGNVTITLADGTTNTLKSVVNCAGLQKNGEYSETLGKLTITGTGTLTATGGDKGAGIGGGGGSSSSNIEISGGKVTATGGGYGAGTGGDFGGAGIGGGKNGSGSNIEISGGTVKAQGGYRAAGIGGGGGGSSSNIEISGGTVTATGGSGGAGIGGGWGCSGSDIKISGGVVTATGSSNGTGIGGGGGGSTDNIKISGGTVKADTIGCTPTDGTANATPVYPLELDVDGTSAVTINGKAYPTKHIDENKLYVYLPAKTAQTPNEVTIGNETTKYIYNTANSKWLVGVVDAPTFTPASGTTFTSTQNVTIACATDGATIYYTTDGSTPTTASTKYTGAITITSTTTIKAIAVKDGMDDSSVVTANYTKNSSSSGGSGGSSSSSSSSSSSDESPNIEGKNGKKGWSAISDVIEDTKEGEKVVIDMNDATEIPRNILSEIKGKDIAIVLNMDNGFIWTINGKDVENPKTIDMGVKKGTRIPVKVINEVTGESKY
ncbi:MAG: chitobiase/beta-hexosaminidase C-terminal domain-containing protein, partial [Oscillospiraceae bacterium]|nr:chitobiase/beta-hexosaminidase C-terminal domain-containing protein [Oscillospiraceae bacterium]